MHSRFQRAALAAALALSALTNAQALTLGYPVVQSKQGEALNAEIDITEISLSELHEFQVSPASADIYRTARLELPASNGSPLDIHVDLMRRNNGKLFIKLSSQLPVDGTSLDLLLDLRWSTGRTLRDVGLTLDDGIEVIQPAPKLKHKAQKACAKARERKQHRSKSSHLKALCA